MKMNIKTLKIITVSLVMFIALLFFAAVFNLISLARISSREARLLRELEEAQVQIIQNENEIGYRESDENIERHARELLNMNRRGETAFVGR